MVSSADRLVAGLTTALLLFAPVLGAANPPTEDGVRVRLTGATSAPLENARVECLDPAGSEVRSAGDDGVAWLDRPCTRVRCSADDHVALELAVESPELRCSLAAGSVVEARFAGARCTDECMLRLRPAGSEAPADVIEARVVPGSDASRLAPVRPGVYEIEVRRAADG
jgi:hypothetical protein